MHVHLLVSFHTFQKFTHVYISSGAGTLLQNVQQHERLLVALL